MKSHSAADARPSIAKKSPTGSLPPAVPLAITPTFRPWTHTSDDSYFYQLSLVVATATVSFSPRVFSTRERRMAAVPTVAPGQLNCGLSAGADPRACTSRNVRTIVFQYTTTYLCFGIHVSRSQYPACMVTPRCIKVCKDVVSRYIYPGTLRGIIPAYIPEYNLGA